jgi:endonuclease/exonuclease/phosphatase family metal-dependent hydrolase
MGLRLTILLFFSLTLNGSFFFSCGPVRNYLSPEGPKFLGEYSKNSSASDDHIKVVSFNIEFGEKIHQAIQELSEYPELRDADILLLQEMNESGVESISKALQYNYVYYPSVIHRHHHKNLGNAILSTWPIKDEKKIILPYPYAIGKTRKTAVSARVAIKGLDVLVYSVQTATILLGKEGRIGQADSILKSVPKNADYVIIGGDFNTVGSWNVAEIEDIFAHNGFVRASKDAGSTLKMGPLKLTLDHIFVRGLRAIDSGTLDKSRASDHFPLWVILKPDRGSF